MSKLIWTSFLLLLPVSASIQSTIHIDCDPQLDPMCTCPPGLTGDDCSVDIDECLFTNCSYHGTCVNEYSSYTCECDPGFTGADCDFDINECGLLSPPDCGVHGNCVDTYGSYECVCEPGYTGDDCEIDINECEEHGCANGICTDLVNDYQCDCFMGWTGKQCKVDINECYAPDRKFGLCDETGTNSCDDGNNTYTCNCVVGFTGFNCSEDIKECDIGLCLNNATCVDFLFGIFECECAEGFTGERCELDLSPCDPDSCQYNSTCFDEHTFPLNFPQGTRGITSLETGDYFCDCLPGFDGKDCSNECPSEPCLNSGQCMDTAESYICECEPGFTGRHCEIDLDVCTSTTCLNGGTCTDGYGASFECTCVHGFNGSLCENDLPFCRNDSCWNNGTCMEGIGNATSCECAQGYGGPDCSDDLDFCTESICRNGGTCIEGEGIVVSCLCPNGTVGEYCDLPDEGMNPIVVIVIIVVAIVILMFLVCFITVLCLLGHLERKKRTKSYQINMWTLKYQHSPVAVATLDDTIPDPEFNYRDIEARYMDTMSHSSFESQTAMVQFNRTGSVASIRSNLVRASSTRGSFVRTPSSRSRGRAVQTDKLGKVRKEDLADMLELGMSTFKPTSS